MKFQNVIILKYNYYITGGCYEYCVVMVRLKKYFFPTAIWHGSLGCYSKGPRLWFAPRSGCATSLLSFSSCLQDFINRLEQKAAFISSPNYQFWLRSMAGPGFKSWPGRAFTYKFEWEIKSIHMLLTSTCTMCFKS